MDRAKLRNSLQNFGIVLFLVIMFILQYVNAALTTVGLGTRLKTLHDTVEYMAKRPEQMNVDAIFGITLVEANTMACLEHPKINVLDKEYRRILKNILRISRNARINTMSIINLKNEQYQTYEPEVSFTVTRIMNQPKIWIRPIPWRLGLLGKIPVAGEGLTSSSTKRIMYQGTPQENESDKCLIHLSLGGLQRNCKVSGDCAEMLLRDDNPRGYPLTHRLLYIQLARALGCQEHLRTNFTQLIPLYCKLILQDLVELEATGFPEMARDLATEQVLLCGMEGFLEFANDHYTSLILSWPNYAGCFNAFGFESDTRNFKNLGIRNRRESSATDFGCDNHSTALGAASLALLIRQYVEVGTGM